MKTARILFSLVTLSVLLAACGQQSAPANVSEDLDLVLRVDPVPPAVGQTTLIATLKDANGLPVDGARLLLHGDMDHEGMTQVDLETSESLGGEYRIPFEWTMGGGWIVTVTAQTPSGGEISETLDVFVEAVSSESIINRRVNSDSSAVNIAYQPDNDPAMGGAATVTVTLTDTTGHPINDALVEIVGEMAHAGMMPISGTGELTEDGRYVVPLYWTMAGDWQVSVQVTLADGRQFAQEFDQRVEVR